MNPFGQFNNTRTVRRTDDGEFFNGLQFALFFLTFLVCLVAIHHIGGV